MAVLATWGIIIVIGATSFGIYQKAKVVALKTQILSLKNKVAYLEALEENNKSKIIELEAKLYKVDGWSDY